MANHLISRISSSHYLNECAKSLEIDAFIMKNPAQGDERPSPKVVATMVQAILGAIWLDSGKDIQIIKQTFQHLDTTWGSGIGGN